MGEKLSKALGQEAAPQQGGKQQNNAPKQGGKQQNEKPQTDPLDTRPQGVRQKDYGGEAPFGRDGGGKAFQSQVHADCYARSAAAKAARLATRRDLATEDNEDYGEAQAGRDADAADAAFAAFLSDDASKPCVLVQVAKYTLADKFCRLANDARTSAKALPGLRHGGAVAPPRRKQEKDAKSNNEVAWVALRGVEDFGAVRRALEASPEGILGRALVQRLYWAPRRLTKDDDASIVAACLEALAAQLGGKTTARVAVRGQPKALEKLIAGAVAADARFQLEAQACDLVVHAAKLPRLGGAFVGACVATDEWRAHRRDTPPTVCRAAWKMREVLAFGLDGGALETARGRADRYVVDAGAAPGGWSGVLAEKGIRVIACDPADLDESVAALAGVTHARRKVEDLDPDNYGIPAGALCAGVVCDMNCHPAQLVEVLAPLLKRLAPGAAVVLTLKFGGRGHGAMGERRKRTYCAEILRDLDACAGPFEPACALEWLVSNTDRERTFIAQRLLE